MDLNSPQNYAPNLSYFTSENELALDWPGLTLSKWVNSVQWSSACAYNTARGLGEPSPGAVLFLLFWPDRANFGPWESFIFKITSQTFVINNDFLSDVPKALLLFPPYSSCIQCNNILIPTIQTISSFRKRRYKYLVIFYTAFICLGFD